MTHPCISRTALLLGGLLFLAPAVRADEEVQQLWHEGPLVPGKIESPFATLAKKLEPAVVNISFTRAVDISGDLPFEDFGFKHPRIRPRFRAPAAASSSTRTATSSRTTTSWTARRRSRCILPTARPIRPR